MDKAKLVCENSDSLTLTVLETPISENCKNCDKGFTDIATTTIEVETDGLNEQHSGVLNAFSSHIINGTPLVADGTEGIRGLMISNAAHLSSWTGDAVTLPVDEDVFYAELQKRVATSKAKENVVETVVSDMSSTF